MTTATGTRQASLWMSHGGLGRGVPVGPGAQGGERMRLAGHRDKERPPPVRQARGGHDDRNQGTLEDPRPPHRAPGCRKLGMGSSE